MRKLRSMNSKWKKARNGYYPFGLYIVTRAVTKAPQLQRIENPAVHFQMDEDIFATGFIIPEVKWQTTMV